MKGDFDGLLKVCLKDVLLHSDPKVRCRECSKYFLMGKEYERINRSKGGKNINFTY